MSATSQATKGENVGQNREAGRLTKHGKAERKKEAK
jgi:hypothetical protein